MGRLEVSVLAGRNLAAKDSGGTSDPYVVLALGSQKRKTECIKKTLNPKWEERDFVFDDVQRDSTVLVTCFDKDMFSDDYMGETVLGPMHVFEDVPSVEKWFPLNNASKPSEKVSGDLLIKLKYIPSQSALAPPTRKKYPHDKAKLGITDEESTEALPSLPDARLSPQQNPSPKPASNPAFASAAPPTKPQDGSSIGGSIQRVTSQRMDAAAVHHPQLVVSPPGTAVNPVSSRPSVQTGPTTAYADTPPARSVVVKGAKLSVTVAEARGLVARDSNGKSDPYCILRYSGRETRTGVQDRTLSPVWDETFLFDVTDPMQPLTVLIFDKDRFASDDYMGEVAVASSRLASMDEWLPVISTQPKEKATGELRLITHVMPPAQPPPQPNLAPGSGSSAAISSALSASSQVRARRGSLDDAAEARGPTSATTQRSADDTRNDLVRNVAQPRSDIATTVPDKGVLELEIIEGQDLVSRDSNGKSDPFCIVHFGKDEKQTKVIPTTLFPVWKETFLFPFNKDSPRLLIRVFDKDMLGKDSMGQVEIDVQDVLRQGLVDFWLPVQPQKPKESVSGRLHLKLVVRPEPRMQTPAPPPVSDPTTSASKKNSAETVVTAAAKVSERFGDVSKKGKLTVQVVEGRKLVSRDKNGLSDPRCVIRLGSEEAQTSVKPKTLNPDWGETFLMRCAEGLDKLLVFIFDEDMFGKDSMGVVEVPWSDLQLGPVDKWYEVKPQKPNEAVSGELHLILSYTPEEIAAPVSGPAPARAVSNSRHVDARRTSQPPEVLTSQVLEVAGGMLKVDILEGRGLVSRDRNGFSDPFCVVRLGPKEAKTSVKKKTLDPVWMESFSLPISPGSHKLQIAIFDEDLLSKESMGLVELPIAEAVKGPIDSWFPVQPSTINESVSGALHVRLRYVTEAQPTVPEVQTGSAVTQLTKVQSKNKQLQQNGQSRSAFDSLVRPASPGLQSGALPRPGDMIEIRVIEGKGLVARDINGKSDPYCLVQLGVNEAQSTVKDNTLNPVWNESVILPVGENCESITVLIYDKDILGKDSMGQVVIPLALLAEGRVDEWFRVLPQKAKEQVSGELHLQIGVQNSGRKESVKNSSPAVLFSPPMLEPGASPRPGDLIEVKVIEGKGLIARDQNGKSDPYCVVQLGGKEARTTVKDSTLDPVWNETLVLPVGANCPDVTLLIFDKDLLGKDSMGQVVIPLASLAAGRLDQWFPVLPQKAKEQVSGELHVQIGVQDKGQSNLDKGRSTSSAFDALLRPASPGLQSNALPQVGDLIKVKVIEGKGLVARDLNGKSDPYCVVQLGPKEAQTAVKDNTLDPVWNETVVLPVTNDCERLTVLIFDKDMFGKDSMGQVQIPLAALAEKSVDEWFQVLPQKANEKVSGELHLHISLEEKSKPIAPSNTLSQTASSALQPGRPPHLGDLIEVKVIEGKGLVARDLNGKSDPYCVVRLGGKEAKTAVKDNTLNPVWNETVVLPLTENCESVMVLIFDKDLLGKDSMGQVVIPLASLGERHLDRWFQVLPQTSKEVVSGELHLQLSVQEKGQAGSTFDFSPLRSASPGLQSRPGPRPGDLIEVHVVEGKGLVARDRNGKSDPYCVVELGGKEAKTAVKDKTLDPVWNETVVLPVTKDSESITVRIFDKDVFGKDSMGQVVISLASLTEGGLDEWFQVLPQTAKEHVSGELHLQIKVKEQGPAVSHVKATSPAIQLGALPQLGELIEVQIVEGKGLVGRDLNGKSDPYCIVKLGDKEAKTAVKDNTLDPVWNETLLLPFTEKCESVTVLIFDKDVFGKDSMGQVVIPLTMLAEKRLDQWFRVLPQKPKEQVSGELHVRIAVQDNRSPAVSSSKAGLSDAQSRAASGTGDLIEVQVVEGKGLVARDRNGKSDPYCIVRLGGKEAKTAVKDKTLDPVWNESVVLPVTEGCESVTVLIFDKDVLGKDSMGQVVVPLESLAEGRLDEWFQVRPQKNKEQVSGELHLIIAVQERNRLGAAVSGSAVAKGNQIQIEVVEGKDLVARDRNGKSDPFCVIKLGKEKAKTSVQKATLSPVWNETFCLTCYPDSQTVLFSLFDDDLIGKDSMGQVEVPLSLVPVHDEILDRWFPVQPVKKSEKVSGDLHLRLCYLSDPTGSIPLPEANLKHAKIPELKVPGTLDVTVWRGRYLLAADSNGSSDPYCEVSVEGSKFRSRVVQKTLNPEWNFSCNFKVTRPDAVLQLTVFDKDMITRDDYLGEVSIPVASIAHQPSKDWHDLKSARKGIKSQGSVLLAAQYRSAAAEQAAHLATALRSNPGLLKVSLIEARCTSWSDPSQSADMFAKVQFGDITFSSGVAWGDLNPKWSEDFEFASVTDLTPLLVVTVFCKDTNLGDTYLGEVQVDLQELQLEGAAVDQWYTLFTSHPKTKWKGRLRARTALLRGASLVRNQGAPLAQNAGGRLRITVMNGRNLCGKDSNGLSDPYVVLAVGERRKQTSVQFKTLDPSWNETVEFDAVDASSDVSAVVWDRDKFTGDDYLGECPLHIPKSGVNFEDWVPLHAGKGRKDKVSGELRIRMIFIDEQSRPASSVQVGHQAALARFSPWSLILSVIEGRDFSKQDAVSSDPYCLLSVGKQQFQTEIQRGTLNPKWSNATFSFDILEAASQVLVQVWDKDFLNKDDFIGELRLNVDEMMATSDSQKQWFALQPRTSKEKVRGSLLLQYSRTDSKQASQTVDTVHAGGPTIIPETVHVGGVSASAKREGTLVVRVIEASVAGLRASGQVQQALCTVSVGQTDKPTLQAEASIQAGDVRQWVFDEDLNFDVTSLESDIIVSLLVGQGSNAACCGQTRISVASVSDGEELCKWFKLMPVPSPSPLSNAAPSLARGAVRLSLLFKPEHPFTLPSSPPPTLPSPKAAPLRQELGRLRIGVIDGASFTDDDDLSQRTMKMRSYYCQLMLDNQECITCSVPASPRPTWNENFTLNVYDKHAVLAVLVFDCVADTLHSTHRPPIEEACFGEIRLNVADLGDDILHDKWFRVQPLSSAVMQSSYVSSPERSRAQRVPLLHLKIRFVSRLTAKQRRETSTALHVQLRNVRKAMSFAPQDDGLDITINSAEQTRRPWRASGRYVEETETANEYDYDRNSPAPTRSLPQFTGQQRLSRGDVPPAQVVIQNIRSARTHTSPIHMYPLDESHSYTKEYVHRSPSPPAQQPGWLSKTERVQHAQRVARASSRVDSHLDEEYLPPTRERELVEEIKHLKRLVHRWEEAAVIRHSREQEEEVAVETLSEQIENKKAKRAELTEELVYLKHEIRRCEATAAQRRVQLQAMQREKVQLSRQLENALAVRNRQVEVHHPSEDHLLIDKLSETAAALSRTVLDKEERLTASYALIRRCIQSTIDAPSTNTSPSSSLVAERTRRLKLFDVFMSRRGDNSKAMHSIIETMEANETLCRRLLALQRALSQPLTAEYSDVVSSASQYLAALSAEVRQAEIQLELMSTKQQLDLGDVQFRQRDLSAKLQSKVVKEQLLLKRCQELKKILKSRQ